LFASCQERERKVVERAFGVLQKRWVIRHPTRLWEREELANIMYACVILHNMIIKDERDIYDIPDDNTYEQAQSSPNLIGLAHGPIYGFTDVLDKYMEIRNQSTHIHLKEDLIEHIWQKFSTQQHEPSQE
jgi:hypothetical protein